MTTALAIAAVTASMQDLLKRGFSDLQLGNVVGGKIDVTATPPDRIALDAPGNNNRVNLFLYNVTRNSGYANLGQPVRDATGGRVASPSLGIDLHYLVTAYGLRDLDSEILLGCAMQLFFETPVLTRTAISGALNPNPAPPHFPQALASSRLEEQFEQIRITHDPISTEEVSRVWTALSVHYRPTAAYQASVVLIESTRTRRAALPVAVRNTYVETLDPPFIERVDADADPIDPSAPITPDSTLRARGRSLAAPGFGVKVNGLDMTAGIVESHATFVRVSLKLPQPGGARALPAGLYAGIAMLQVVHPRALGTPATAHAGPASNLAPFILRPSIRASVAGATQPDNVNGTPARRGRIEVRFVPRIGIRQKVALLLNERDPPAARAGRAYSIAAPPNNGLDPTVDTDTDRIRFAFRRVEPGSYLVRVQVDGAESLLDADQGTGRFAKPFVTI